MKILRKNLNEILLAYYIFSFVLLARIIPGYENKSTKILLINMILILLISVIHNFKRIKFSVQEIVIYLSIIAYAIIDYNYRVNEFTVQIYQYLIIFAAIPTFLFTKIENTKAFIKSYTVFSIITAILFLLDPLQEYKYSGDYMGFGYNVMLPACLGIYIKARNEKKLWSKLLLIAVLIEMFIFANKGAIISVGVFIVLYELFVKKQTLKNLLIVVLGCLIVLFLNPIMESIHDVAIANGIDSYSIETLYQMTTRTSSGLSGREDIWNSARAIIEKNFLLGNGAGFYRTTNSQGLYTHNIIYDVMIEYGIIIFIILSSVVVKGILKIKNEKEKELGLLLLMMWFPKLLLSSYFQSDIGFWLFVIWSVYDKTKTQGVRDENKKFSY